MNSIVTATTPHEGEDSTKVIIIARSLLISLKEETEFILSQINLTS